MRLSLLLMILALYVGCTPSPRYPTLLGALDGSTSLASLEPSPLESATEISSEEPLDDREDFRETKAEVTRKSTSSKKGTTETPATPSQTPQPITPKETTPKVSEPIGADTIHNLTSETLPAASAPTTELTPIPIPFTPPKPMDTTIQARTDLQPDGLVSWYGPGFQGRKTASGEKFDMHDFTAAHRTLPFGTKVEVIVLTTGRSSIVRINDRGPQSQSRVIDVSKAAAQQLGIINTGPVPVALRIIE